MQKQRLTQLSRALGTNYFTILFFWGLFLTPSVLQAQIQSEFKTPAVLTACNLDTICLKISNIKGVKNASYGNATVQFNLPNASLLNMLPNSVYSVPTGAVQTSYVGDVLTVTVPMPAFGATTEVCFVVRPKCDITTITPLPRLQSTITYPVGYPVASESVSSLPMNVGAVSLTHTLYNLTTLGNPSPAFGAQYPIVSFIQNTGFGTQKEVIYKTVVPNTHTFSAFFSYAIDVTGAYIFNGYMTPTITPYDAGHNLHTYVLKGKNLGPDGLFTPGEKISPYEYLIATQVCSTFTAKRWPEISCGSGEPLCIKPDTLYSTITQAAGTPKLEGTLVSMEQADGCPNKHGIFKVKNTGVGNAAPVGNAYDVDLSISFNSGLMLLSNIQLNGIAVPSANLVPYGLAATSTTIKMKDFLTTDPDGAGVGIEDLDGDGFYDDMLVGAETTVSFDYTIPCDLACGAQLDYNLTSYNTFTDYCRTLVGVTSTPLHRFGFQQVQAIEQSEQVDYGTLGVGDQVTKTAKFKFQYKQNNMDFTNASGELRIRYMNRMELNPASILLNGVAPTNTPVLMGDNSTGAVPDNDSMYVVTLTPAELTSLFDTSADSLWYDQTYYGCAIRQNNTVGDTWQLVVKVKQTLCSDGSSACGFDIGCKKPFAYTYNTGCGVKPCYVQEVKTYRESPTGFTAPDEITPISPIDSSRSWTGDTVVMKNAFYITGDAAHEPNGYWTAQGSPFKDIRTVFALKYSTPKGWNGTQTIWSFLPNYSTVSIYQRTPDPDPLKKGTIGTKIIEVPILLSDFANDGSNHSATTQHSFNAVEYDYGTSAIGEPTWYCTNDPTAWHISGLCPIQNKYWYDSDYTTLHYARYRNMAEDKISETYYINIGRALARGGWTGNTGDDNYYFEVKTKWRMNEDFPWDNSNSFSATGNTDHLGTYQDFPTSYQYNTNCSYNGSCGYFGTTHLTMTKEHYISNPNAVYSADCNLKVNHDVFFKTYEGNYFQNGEVRVPLKIDSVVIDLPTEYGLTPGTFSWKYNQSCGDLTSTSIAASASTGHVIFTNSGGGDFPRADDCSGNKVAYQLCYTLAKTGTAAPTQYRFPIKIYGRDESDNAVIMSDSATIAEAKPELTLTPLTPILTPADGGACEPAYFDFQIQNNTLFDAGHVYLAAESTAGTTIVRIGDGDNVYADPIISTDVSTYGASNVFAKLGTIKAGDIRKVRVYANTNICADNFNVYVDLGCAYPSPLQPNLASTTIDQTSAQYQAQAPGISSLPVSDINVATLCDVKTVEVDVRNIRLGNLYKGNVLFDLPAGASMVAGTAQYHFPNAPAYDWVTIPSGDVTQPAADMVNLNLANLNPFNTTCGLQGADAFALSHFRVKFNIEFTACPTNSKDYIAYTASGENYCGTASTTQGVVHINYIGTSTAFNNYELAYSASPIKVCTYIGESQTVRDTIIIKNIGGFGTSSGTSTGADSLLLTALLDTTRFQISNITLPAGFATPTFTYDIQGNRVIHTNVPAGIAVNGTLNLILTYDMKAKVVDLCKSGLSELCYSTVIKSSPDLSCPAKGLSCAASFASIQGHKFSTRPFVCCFTALGNLVFMDTDANGTFTTGTDMGVNGATVWLFKEGDNPATATPLATTTTAGGGFYLFDQLEQGKYFVFLPSSNFDSGGALNNKNSSLTEGTDETTDDNSDENGQNTLIAGGVTSQLVELRANQEPTGETGAGVYSGTLDDNDVNLTIDFGFCANPTITSVAADTATCTNGVINVDAAVAVRGITGMAKYAYSTNGTTGLFANTATASTADSIRISNIASPSVPTTYTFRIWGIDTNCYNDTTVILNPSVCPQCAITGTFTQDACNDNATSAITTDDFFTVTVSAVSATNGGTSGKYEVVLNGTTVLNTGGTTYGTSVSVGGAGVFAADGTTTYTLTVRDLDNTSCASTPFTTMPTQNCSVINCPTPVCIPVTVIKMN